MNNIGKIKHFTDVLDPARAAAMHAALNLSGPAPSGGDPLPAFWHYGHFWDALPPAGLGRDGHPRTGDFIPNLGLPRRMWAGGKLVFQRPLMIGTGAKKASKISDIVQKNARTGRLAIVTLQHEITQNEVVCVTEEQSLIYRSDATPADLKPDPPTAPTGETVKQTRKFSVVDLFRYSALTCNGHRIHYDRDYAMNVEGYAGLVVHGPLLGQMLVHLAKSLLGELNTFSFRATAPLFDFETAEFCAKQEGQAISLWVRGPDGRLCLEAQAT